jgi:hypothetical protein
VADRDGAHGAPAGWQVHRAGGYVLAEQRARDPRRAEPFDGERDEQVLHCRADRDGEHGLFRGRTPLVGIVVRRVADQARHHNQRRLPQRLPAPDPAGDLLRRKPVPAQVGDPGLAHRVEQGRAGRGRFQHYEPPRLAVVRRGRGQRGGDGPADRLGVDRLGGERPDGPAGQGHVRGSEPEHVLLGRPDQRPRARAVLLGDELGQPAHDRDRDVPRLALHQVRGRGDLVRDGGDGDLQDVAERVRLAAIVPHRDYAGGADGVVGLPGPPRPAHRVGDHHAERHAGAVVQRLAEPTGGLVRVLGQQHDGPRGGVGLIHASCRQHQSVPGLRDGGGAAPGHHPHRLGLDGLLPRDGDHPALRLTHDLRGDDEDVARAQVRGGRGDERGEVAARGDLGQPGDRHDGNRRSGHYLSSWARSSAARAMAAVAGRSRM